jgi:putative endonuclease
VPDALDRFRAHADPAGRGRVGEEDAVAWLRRQGYRVVERNARTPAGEIDVVAEEGATLCFVEIKARTSTEYGPAVEAVGRSKQRRLVRAAALWLAAHPTGAACRFDVLALDAAAGGWEFTLVRAAFEG